MGEDFPLDPNQVQQPHPEGDTTHIEVTAHGGDSQESDDHSVPPATANHDTSGYIKDKDKAETMAHAHNDALDENDGKSYIEWVKSPARKPSWKSPEHAAHEAGDEYDLGVALKKEKFSHINTPEQAREFASANRNVFLRYSHAIAENHRKFGDKLSPSLQALDMVHGLVENVGYNEFPTFRSNSDPNAVRVKLDENAGGAVVVSTMRYNDEPKEQWRLPMFGEGKYSVTQTTGDPDGEFSVVVTEKTRSLGEKDVETLSKLLEPAAKYKAQEKKWEEQSQDEDYARMIQEADEEAENMAEVNYGRDL